MAWQCVAAPEPVCAHTQRRLQTLAVAATLCTAFFYYFPAAWRVDFHSPSQLNTFSANEVTSVVSRSSAATAAHALHARASTTTSDTSPRKSGTTEHGFDRAVLDLKLDRRRCKFMPASATLEEDVMGSCKTSATCPFGQFCHFEDKFCADFCRSSSSGSQKSLPNNVPRPNDVWIVSYPKSGSTWLRHLIWNLHIQSSPADGSPKVPDRPSTFSEVDAGIPFIEDNTGGRMDKTFEANVDLRIFKSHQPYSCDVSPCQGYVANEQEEWQCECPNCASKFRRVIYIVRDGRPVMASYWKFLSELKVSGNEKDFAEFLSLGLRRYPGVGWSDHVRSWMSAPAGDKLDILWIRYEDMLSDAAAALVRVAKWLRLKSASNEEAIEWAVQASSAESMAKTEKLSGPGIFNYYKDRDPDFRMVHLDASKDDQSSWRKHFVQPVTTPRGNDEGNVARAFNAEHKYMLECLDYPTDITNSWRL